MKFAKLGFETKEGLSIANYSEGWSMEYGEGGSYHCDLLYKGKVVCDVTEEGNGGPLNYWIRDEKLREEVGKATVEFLKRNNEDYGPNTKYEFCKNITTASELEYSSLINDLLDEFQNRKTASKYLKQGYTCVAVIKQDLSNRVIAGKKTVEEIEKYIKDKQIPGTVTIYDQVTVKNKTF